MRDATVVGRSGASPANALADGPRQAKKARARVLIVDDDLGTREWLGWILDDAGFATVHADCGREAIRRARSGRFDLMIVDLSMPDLEGTEVVRLLQADSVCPPFVLFSAFLSTPITVEAMRLGALDVFDKRMDLDEIVRKVIALTSISHPGKLTLRELPQPCNSGVASASVAARWASWVLRACDSPRDLRTVREWAHFVGTNDTSLRDCCRMVGVRSRDARDLMRTLRVVLRQRAGHREIASLLSVGDRRTMRQLLRRAGLLPPPARPYRPDEFLDRQGFVPSDIGGLLELKGLLAQTDSWVERHEAANRRS